jgi:hypothetical protein
MDERPATLAVQLVVGPESDAEEVAEATQRLRRELLDLDVEAVGLERAGEPPPGTRAADVMALGALVVSVAKSQVLVSIVAAVRSWLGGQQQKSIKLQLDGDVLEPVRIPWLLVTR